MSADRTADWTPGKRLHALLAQEINDAPAAELIKAAVDDVLRGWAAKIREVGTAKGWSRWAAAYIDPDVEFTDTAMPSTETIIAELRRLDRVDVLREGANAIEELPPDYECDPGRGDAAKLLRDMADEAEKDTSVGTQPTAGGATPAELTRLRAFASATEKRHDEIRARLAMVDIRDSASAWDLGMAITAILDGPLDPETAPDFFRPGHTYRRRRWRFQCLAVGPDPFTGETHAAGYLYRPGESATVSGLDPEAWAHQGWCDITDSSRATDPPAAHPDATARDTSYDTDTEGPSR